MSHARQEGRRTLTYARRSGCLVQAVDIEGDCRGGDRMQSPSEASMRALAKGTPLIMKNKCAESVEQKCVINAGACGKTKQKKNTSM